MDNLTNLFNSVIGSKDTESQVPLLVIIITTIIPMGQFITRIFWLDGSLDKIWTMFPLLWFFPFSIIPSILMYFGYVKKGPGGKPYDYFVLIPIIAKFILSFLISMILSCGGGEDGDGDGDDSVNSGNCGINTIFITLAIQIVLGMIPNLIKTSDVCEKLPNNVCKDLTFKSIGKALVDSTIAYSVGELLAVILHFIPIIGPLLFSIGEIPFIGEYIGPQVDNIIWCVGFFITYVFINIINANFMDTFCHPSEYLGKDIFDKIGFIIMLIVAIVLKLYKYYV